MSGVLAISGTALAVRFIPLKMIMDAAKAMRPMSLVCSMTFPDILLMMALMLHVITKPLFRYP